MYIGVKLENYQAIQKKILDSLQKELNSRINKNREGIEKQIRKVLYRAIKAQPEYKSLLGGKLQSELGVTSTNTKLEILINIWIAGIKLTVKRVKVEGNQLVGGVDLIISRDNYKDLLAHPAAEYLTQKGENIEWLRWLLLEGDKTIIRSYQIGIDRTSVSRTGLGNIMIRGGKWSVPSEFSGTRNDNFLTRALEYAEQEINTYIQKILS